MLSPMRATLVLLLALWALRCWSPAVAYADEPTDHVLCHMATAAAERATGVPDQLLSAISRVESGRTDPATGRPEAWPWTINVEGSGHIYDTKQAAIDAVAAFQAQGARSIDVGCMQINLRQHPEAFASLSDAFDPSSNAMFAARFLTSLFQQTGSWPHAAAAYHSQTPELGRDYQNQVLAMWAEGDSQPGVTGPKSRPASQTPNDAGSLFASPGATEGSPFGGAPAAFVASRYHPRPAILSSGSGRSLDDYRGRPIALAARIVMARRF